MRKGAKTAQADKVEIAKRICETYAVGNVTIESCCNANGISWATFWNWCNEKAPGEGEQINEVNEIYKGAQAEKDRAYKSNLKQLARTALEKRVSGYDLEVEETTDEAIAMEGQTGNFSRIRVKKTVRHIPADVRAIMYVLDNTDPANFKSSGEANIDFSKLNETEQAAIIERLAERVKQDTTQWQKTTY